MMTARARWEREQRYAGLPGSAAAKAAAAAGWRPLTDTDRGWDPAAGFEGAGETVQTVMGPRIAGEGRQIP